jgi:hypothetical protein
MPLAVWHSATRSSHTRCPEHPQSRPPFRQREPLDLSLKLVEDACLRSRSKRYLDCPVSGAGAMMIVSLGPVFTTGFVQRTEPRTLSSAVPARDSVMANVC